MPVRERERGCGEERTSESGSDRKLKCCVREWMCMCEHAAAGAWRPFPTQEPLFLLFMIMKLVSVFIKNSNPTTIRKHMPTHNNID
jgi:hypothetical protein